MLYHISKSILCEFVYILDIDECQNSLCERGVCVDGINAYTCNCSGTGYYGDTCQHSMIYYKAKTEREL